MRSEPRCRGLSQRDELTDDQLAGMANAGVFVRGASWGEQDLTYWMTEEIADFIAAQEA